MKLWLRSKIASAGTGLMVVLLSACQTTTPGWHLMLSHTAEGERIAGAQSRLIAAIRSGCQVRIAWGARRRAYPNRTIEHISTPIWLSVRDSTTVEAQLEDFLINLPVLGEPAEEHPRRERFGGTDKVVMWRANLKTDGSFDAIWFYPDTGELVTRVPQTHPMRWYADCQPTDNQPLFPAVTP